MKEMFFLAGLVVLTIFIYKCFSRQGTVSVEAEQAIAILLDDGVEMVLKGYHLYRSIGGGYVLLHFDKDGNMFRDHEEQFTDINDAVAKFVQRTSK